MRDLGVDIYEISQWFLPKFESPYVLIYVSELYASDWANVLAPPFRRCYVDDAELDKRVAETGRPKSELVAARLPDRGSTMAGDFGEILVFLYHATLEPGIDLIGPKKWRLKQDRTKPAPYSDVIHFVLPQWPNSSVDDRILCSEVKTKSTSGTSKPISSAIEDCKKDRTSRLAKTLRWLKERALHEDLGTTTLDHLKRFTEATDHPEAQKQFRAVAVVCTSLINSELTDAPMEDSTDHTVVVIAVPDLKQRYEAVFDAVHTSVAELGGGV